MRTRPLLVCTLTSIIALAFAADPAQASDIGAARPLGGFGVDRGIVRLRCDRSDIEPGLFARSRAIVLDTGNPEPAREVLLVSAHGLPDQSSDIRARCTISGVGGPAIGIAAFFMPDSRGAVDSNDWAVLVTDRPIAAPVRRHRVALSGSGSIDVLRPGGPAVRLVLFSAAADETDCALLGPVTALRALSESLFVHSCRSRPGTSGAPLMLSIDGFDTVVGINLGRMLTAGAHGEPHYVSVARAIDADVASAIVAAKRLALTPPADPSYNRGSRGLFRARRERQR